jgi:very-short-patch-repair endonuclease
MTQADRPRKNSGRKPWARNETPALVCVVTRKKDWSLLQAEHWYRIPLRTAPEGLDKVKYLALYQTRAVGEERWAVNYYAEVKRISTVKRIELLPDEPDHKRADNLYHKLELGELKRLPRPIPSRRLRRIVFIPTTLNRLFRAQEINDLYCGSPIEDRLYDAMKDEALPAERQLYVREAGTGRMLDLAVFCHDGNVDIECDGEAYHSGKEKAKDDRTRDNELTCSGWRILRFSGSEITKDPNACVETIRRAVRRLGGIEKPDAPKQSRR